MRAFPHELRQAVRALCRIPGTAALSIATLGFGIAAATGTFSAVYAAWLRPLPFDHPDGLVYLHTTRQTQAGGTTMFRWSVAAARAVRDSARSFEHLGTYSRTTVGIAIAGDPAEQVDGEVVSAGYFEALRLMPAAGRLFTPDEEPPGHAVAILSDSLWKRRYGSDPAAVSRTLLVNGVPLTIVGVMPPGFEGISGRAALWFPVGMAPALTYREYLTTPQLFINLIGRLRKGVRLEQANAELAAIGSGLPIIVPPGAPPARWSATAVPLGDARVDPRERRSLTLLLSGAGGLLLVTCVNVALLLLTRARSRRGEMAVRLALGASRGRLVRQLLAESAVIAGAGGALGVVLASWGLAWLRTAAPSAIPSAQNNYGQISSFSTPAIDAASLLFAAAIAAAATIAAGLAPAWTSTNTDPAAALAASSRALAGRGRERVFSALVASQIAIAVLLMTGALLLASTVMHLQDARSGFDGSAVAFWINAPASRYVDIEGPAVVQRVLERIQRVPGVLEAAVNRCTPYGASCARTIAFFPEHPTAPSDAPVVGRHYVSPGYFHVVGVALRKGRLLTDDDRAGRPFVTVINETAARRFWPGEDPIGRRVWFGSGTGFTSPSTPLEVVGVVADVKYWPLNEPVGPDFYTSYLQFTYPSSLYVVKASDAATVVPAIRRAVAEIDPAMPIYDVQRIDERAANAVAPARFTATVTTLFAASAAALAALGIFGVMAYSVASRRQELGLRMALGATAADLRVDVLRHALALAIAGSTAGLIAGFWLLRSLRVALYGISSTDPRVLAAAVASMCAVALLAAMLPAWRASATDPMIALRQS